jgi:hypothetical protein
MMHQEPTVHQLRSFGFTLGAMLAGFAVWPVVGGGEPARALLSVAACLVMLGAVYPAALRAVFKGWTAVGNVLGWINTRIILSAIFYLAVTPIGLVRRWLGKDPMGRRRRPELASYRVPREPRAPTHLLKQY